MWLPQAFPHLLSPGSLSRRVFPIIPPGQLLQLAASAGCRKALRCHSHPIWQITCLDCPPIFSSLRRPLPAARQRLATHTWFTPAKASCTMPGVAPAGWQTEVITSSLYGIGNAAIAFDPQGDLHIAYILNFSSGGALYSCIPRTPQIVSTSGFTTSSALMHRSVEWRLIPTGMHAYPILRFRRD